jgi:hypothetical protein
MVGVRARLSLSQLLERFEPHVVSTLLSKHGLPLEQMKRLGRTLALNMCWFLLQNRNAQRTGPHGS